MTACLTRRTMLAAAAVPFVPVPAFAADRPFTPQVGSWRTFEITTTVEVVDARGDCRLWLPVPAIATAWQQPVANRWHSQAGRTWMAADKGGTVQMLYAEFDAAVARPAVTLVSEVRTRGRQVQWGSQDAKPEDPAVLHAALQPAELLPLDGIVLDTARKATAGARTDVDKVRAIYDWVVANSRRDNAVRGCGIGDIKSMLESGNLSGKCADLNALFVGLCRASGVPARDLYGIRVAPSAFDYKALGASSDSLSGAQHCRAEAYLEGHGWVAMDPADVLKVALAEAEHHPADRITEVVAPVRAGLFGNWEGNWVAFNNAHDVALPGSRGGTVLPFLMYPNGENTESRFDSLSPKTFRYQISARELKTS